MPRTHTRNSLCTRKSLRAFATLSLSSTVAYKFFVNIHTGSFKGGIMGHRPPCLRISCVKSLGNVKACIGIANPKNIFSHPPACIFRHIFRLYRCKKLSVKLSCKKGNLRVIGPLYLLGLEHTCNSIIIMMVLKLSSEIH